MVNGRNQIFNIAGLAHDHRRTDCQRGSGESLLAIEENDPPGKSKEDGRGRYLETTNDTKQDKESKKATPAEQTRYRSVIMRCNYLAQDRPDIMWACKRGANSHAV